MQGKDKERMTRLSQKSKNEAASYTHLAQRAGVRTQEAIMRVFDEV